VIAAYLQALLKHDVYITDINEAGETEFWKLDKALYGLKQAGHEWFKTLERIMATFGMSQCIGDEGTYTSKDHNLVIGTHVDDLLGIAPTEADLDVAEKGAEKHVELDKRGKPSKMLGMELKWNKDSVVLTQTALIESMTKQFLTDGAPGKTHSLPLEPRCYMKDIEVSEKPERYQSIVGGLLFIARMTRPEISINVNLLGRRTTDASPTNWMTALGVLGYLRSTKHEGITLRKAADLHIRIYADVSYGGEGARSQTGVLTTLGNQAIGWYSRRQDVVSLSITEAEYIADCEGAKDAAWSQQFLAEIGITTTPSLYTDSEGAWGLSQTSKFARRSRHIDHRYHYIRQQNWSGKLIMKTIPGKDNPADILTKLIPMSFVNGWKKIWMSTSETSIE